MIDRLRQRGQNGRVPQRPAIVVVFLLLPLFLTSCRPISYYVKSIQIDKDLHVSDVGSRTIMKSAQPPYYMFFHAATGLTMVSHWAVSSGAGQQPKHVFQLETNPGGLLFMTQKTVEILSGPYGSVDAEKKCFFNQPLTSYHSSVAAQVGMRADHEIDEIPDPLPAAPKPLPPLTSISLVRVFRNDPEYTVVSANYEPGGALGSLNVATTKDGERNPGSVIYTHVGIEEPTLTQYGIPRRFDLQTYNSTRKLKLPSVALIPFLVVVNQHYGFDKLIRQDTVQKNTITTTRFLRPSITVEEETLNPLCDAHLQQQQSMGLPTVE